MFDDNDRPSKKPRTQPDAANADTIARANSHVQHLFSRQRPWAGVVGNPGEGEVEPALASETAATEHGRQQQERQERRRGQCGETGSEPGPGNCFKTAELVHYELPGTLERLLTPQVVCRENRRRSMDAANTATSMLPSLPSPAPSDEHTQSPRFAEGQLAQLGARRGYPTGKRTPTEGMPMHISATPVSASPLSAQSPTFPPSTHTSQYMLPGVQQPSTYLMSQPLPQPKQQMPWQQSQHQAPHQTPRQMAWQQVPRHGSHSRPHSINTSSANISGGMAQPLRTPPVLASNQHGPPMSTQIYVPPPRRPSRELFAEISQREESLSKSGKLTPTNNGRLLLLKDSVEKGDWFYQILSQLFCLRAIEPDSLPQSINGIGSKSFDMLDALLCSNRDVDPELLHFFSRFPEPLMDVCFNASGEVRDQYEFRLRMVKDFLIKLPMHWDGLVHRCQEMQSPPLCQDLVETLGLQSVILQTTAFRAIARMFWGLAETKGSRAIEQLHRIDQETFYRQGWRRDSAERNACYRRYHSVFKKWSQATNEQRANFVAPPEVLHYFKCVPQSTVVAAQQRYQQHQRQVQMQAQTSTRPLSPALQTHHQMQMQGHAQAQATQIPPAQHQRHNHLTSTSMAPPGHRSPSLGPRQRALFFPRAESQPRAQPTHPDPNRSALHQAHLRSPILGPITPNPGAPRLYRHIVGYGMPPVKLKRAAAVQQLTFTISQATWKRLAKNESPINPGEPPRRTLTEQSLNFRLRCCTCPANGFATETSWVLTDNYWPDELSFQLNGNDLETRRKLHHGRHLPIDLTEFVHEGTNSLQIILNRMDRDLRKTNFAVAVEAVGVTTHETIRNSLRRVSAAESLDAIKKSLSGEDCGDDDIVLTSSNKTIKLTEPYSGCNMVDIPVRGSECLHHDCFDLEVFLSLCKRPHEGWPTVVDCWRCPICRSDVRPQMLIVDEFLLEVRKTLAKQNMLDARAIVVEANGSWKIKEEEREGVRSASLEREERRAKSLEAAMAPSPKKVVEVIELDD